MKKSSIAAVTAMAAMSLFYCASLSPTGGNGSGVGNGKMTGVLYNADGSRAINASIQVIPTDYNPLGGLNKSAAIAEIRSTATDDTGGFALDSLPEQTFNVFGSNDTNRAFIDSVRIDNKTPAVLAPDTLKSPGGIHGVIRLVPEHDSRSVVIMVLGTTVWTVPVDSIGNFTLQDMAEGRYRVRFLSAQQGYTPLDTQVTVTTGNVGSLPDTLRLPFTGIPVPTGVMTTYDTLKQTVTVWWNRANPALVAGYALYRRNIDSNTMPAVIFRGSPADTFFRDSTVIQDITYEYWVTAVNGQNEEGTKSRSATVTIAGVFSVVDSIVKGSGPQQGQFGDLARIALDSVGNMYITDTKNNRLQKFDSSGDFIFMDDSFMMPIGLSLSGRNELLVSDFDGRKVVKMDLDGRRLAMFSTRGKPWSALATGDRNYVVSDSGIEILDSTGSLVQLIHLNTGIYNTGDIAIDDSGAIVIVLGDKVYRFDEQNKSLALLYQITDRYGNQNCRAVFLRPDVLILMANNFNGPVYSNIFVINLEGTVIAKWSSGQSISDIYSKNNKEIVAVTEEGKILKLTMEKEIN